MRVSDTTSATMSAKGHKLSVHPKHFQEGLRGDLLINPKEFPNLRIGDVVAIYQPDVDFSHLLLQVESLPDENQALHYSVSVEQSIASAFQLRAYSNVVVEKVSPLSVTLDLVELLFKEQYFSRSDMWRLRNSLNNTCVYLNKKIEYVEMRSQVNELWAKGEKVMCGVIAESTRVVFRSSTAVVQIFLQMSSEMWDFDINGDLYFEKAVNGFLTDLFTKWKEQNCCHDVTIVLFSRTFYDAQSKDEFPPSLRECLLVDYKGRIYEDFYRVVIQNERYEDYTHVLMQLRRLFNEYLKVILNYHRPEPGYKMPKATNSTAAQGNFLETLNMSLNLFESPYLDRNFDRTGKVSVVITPGPGVFEVDRELTNITKQRTIDCGVGSDLVCMGEQPLHAAPLFKFHSRRVQRSLEVGDDYNIPHWMNHSFYTSRNQIQMNYHSSFVPRIKPPPEILEDLKKDEKDRKYNKISFTSSAPRYDSEDDNFPFVDYDEYDAQVFKLPSRTNPRAVSGRSASLYGAGGVKRRPSTLAEARQAAQHQRMRNFSDDFAGLGIDRNNPDSIPINVPLGSSSETEMASSVGCYPLGERRMGRESYGSSDGEELGYRRVVGSAGSIGGQSRYLGQTYRPHRALINPFAPSRMQFKMTSNRRRWVHAFPTDPKGAAIQPHHTQVPMYGGEEGAEGGPVYSREVVQASQMAVQHRRQRQISRQDSTEHWGLDFSSMDGIMGLDTSLTGGGESPPVHGLAKSASTASFSLGPSEMSSTPRPKTREKERDKFWLWGPTGEQEWSPEITTGWDWRPLDWSEADACESKLIKPILTADLNSQTFCAGISVDWKSLTIPATLPVTTDYFPDSKTLKHDYVVADYNILPDDVNYDYWMNPATREDESFYRRKPLTTVQVFKELVSQRIAQGFQLIVFAKCNSVQDLAKQAVASSTSPQYQHTASLIRARPRAPTSEEYYLSIGRIFHKLSLTENTITVTRYWPRHPQQELHYEYRYRFKAPDSYSYDVSWTQFHNEKLENYNWSYLDQYITTRGEGDYGLIESLKFWRSRFFLLPCNNPATKKIIDGHERCDIYEERSTTELKMLIAGFVRYLEVLNKIKRTPNTRRPMEIVASESGGDSSPGKHSEAERGKEKGDKEKEKEKEERISVNSPPGKIVDALLEPQTGLSFLPKQPGLPDHCLVSGEAVAWCQLNVQGISSVQQGVALMQTLVDEGYILHASGNSKHKFIYGFYLYFIPQTKGKPVDPQQGYNALFQNEWCEVSVLPLAEPDSQTSLGMFHLAPDMPRKSSDSFLSPPLEDWRIQTGLNKQGWGQHSGKINICAKKVVEVAFAYAWKTVQGNLKNARRRRLVDPTLLHKYVNVEVDVNNKSDRPEMASARYHAYYSPKCAFELQIQWMVSTGCLLGDLVNMFYRKAAACGFHLLPVPGDPFALPYTHNSDPLRGPIFIPLCFRSLRNRGEELFADCSSEMKQERLENFMESILKRFGFMPASVKLPQHPGGSAPGGGGTQESQAWDSQTQYVHCTGGMFALIPDIAHTPVPHPNILESPSSSFVKRTSSELQSTYAVRQLSSGVFEQNEVCPGFLWSWNFMLSRKWRDQKTGDETFQDRMLADFRKFCSNNEDRLQNYVHEYCSKDGSGPASP